MPQEIRVLQCFDCKTYQVDIVKKAKKWQCKICGAKQSVKREFLRGTGADCRLKVQRLNMEKGLAAEQEQNTIADLLQNDDIDWDEITKIEQETSANKSFHEKKDNKWNSYVDNVDATKAVYKEQTFNLNFNANGAGFSKRKMTADVSNLHSSKKVSKWNDYL